MKRTISTLGAMALAFLPQAALAQGEAAAPLITLINETSGVGVAIGAGVLGLSSIMIGVFGSMTGRIEPERVKNLIYAGAMIFIIPAVLVLIFNVVTGNLGQ